MTETQKTTRTGHILTAANSVAWWVNNSDMSVREALDYVRGKNNKLKMTDDQSDEFWDEVESLAETKTATTFGIRDTDIVKLPALGKRRKNKGLSKHLPKDEGYTKLVKLDGGKGKPHTVLLVRSGHKTHREMWNAYQAEQRSRREPTE